METHNSLLHACIEYIQNGYSIIPLGRDKKPLIEWKQYQTKKADIVEVASWLEKFPEMQVGIVTGAISNLVVVDVEAGGDTSIFPPTRMAKTGGGGYHLYYTHPQHQIKNGVRVADLTDIRGDGGYVVAPPSVSNKGSYEWVNHEPMALYPEETVRSLSQVSTEKLVQTGDRNSSAAKVMGELINLHPHDHTLVWSLLSDWNKTQVAEPLDEEELKSVFTSITKLNETERKEHTLALKPFTLEELYNEELPPIEWLVDGLIPLGVMGAITGESNSYKSFLTQAMAQAVATNTSFLEHFTVKAGTVLIIDEENNRRIINKRFRDMGVSGHSNIYFLSQTGLMLDNRYHLDALKRLVDELNPNLVIFDSLVRFHNRDENSSSEMRHIMKSMQALVNESRTVIFIHHHKKAQGSMQSSGSAGVRGAGDIFNALDFHLSIKRNSQTLTVHQHKLRIQAEMKPFNVAVGTSPHISFTYNGEDTSRQDAIEEIKHRIYGLLFDAAGEEISRPDIIKETGVSQKLVDEGLKQLTEKNLIEYRAGAHGKHMYRLLTSSEVVAEENNDEIPY